MQILKFTASGGFRDDSVANKSRNDGSYLYPVISANGHQVFSAAALLKHHDEILYPNDEDYVWRKHWAIWDAPSSSGLNAQYLHTHINGLQKRVKIPNAQSLSGMTAKGDMVIVVDRSRIHWSCDRGNTWQNELHGAENHFTNTGTTHSRGYTHVMSDLYDDAWVDAFYGIQYRDTGSDANDPTNRRSQVINIRFNTSSLCIG